jgi:pyridoxal phosphate enzyme (YggS family)
MAPRPDAFAMLESMSILERLAEVQQAIQTHAGKRPVTLVAVSKYASIEQMREAYGAGVRHFGENKVQDALAKMTALPPEEFPELRWHFIGNLQSNKAKKTCGQFSLIHAIDSIRLAQTVSDLNMSENHCQDILLQVNLSNDPTRHGFSPESLPAALPQILGMSGLRLRGLMGMAPQEASLDNDQEALQRVFCGLRDLKEQLAQQFAIDLPELSMGMSHDYIHALDCGATIIRLGNYLFKN